MGRPIKSKYFGLRKGLDVAGEGVTAITIGVTPVSTLSVSVVIGAPDIPGGTQATATANKTGNNVSSVTMTNNGSGYLNIPLVSFTGTNMTTQGSATATISINTVSAIIVCQAFVPTAAGGSSAATGDILEQVASKSYRVQTSQGTGTCRLVSTTTALSAGQLRIKATDANGSTYFVKKMTSRRVVLERSTQSGSFLYLTNGIAGWNLTAANTASQTVLIDNR